MCYKSDWKKLFRTTKRKTKTFHKNCNNLLNSDTGFKVNSSQLSMNFKLTNKNFNPTGTDSDLDKNSNKMESKIQSLKANKITIESKNVEPVFSGKITGGNNQMHIETQLNKMDKIVIEMKVNNTGKIGDENKSLKINPKQITANQWLKVSKAAEKDRMQVNDNEKWQPISKSLLAKLAKDKLPKLSFLAELNKSGYDHNKEKNNGGSITSKNDQTSYMAGSKNHLGWFKSPKRNLNIDSQLFSNTSLKQRKDELAKQLHQIFHESSLKYYWGIKKLDEKELDDWESDEADELEKVDTNQLFSRINLKQSFTLNPNELSKPAIKLSPAVLFDSMPKVLKPNQPSLSSQKNYIELNESLPRPSAGRKFPENHKENLPIDLKLEMNSIQNSIKQFMKLTKEQLPKIVFSTPPPSQSDHPLNCSLCKPNYSNETCTCGVSLRMSLTNEKTNIKLHESIPRPSLTRKFSDDYKETLPIDLKTEMKLAQNSIEQFHKLTKEQLPRIEFKISPPSQCEYSSRSEYPSQACPCGASLTMPIELDKTCIKLSQHPSTLAKISPDRKEILPIDFQTEMSMAKKYAEQFMKLTKDQLPKIQWCWPKKESNKIEPNIGTSKLFTVSSKFSPFTISTLSKQSKWPILASNILNMPIQLTDRPDKNLADNFTGIRAISEESSYEEILQLSHHAKTLLINNEYYIENFITEAEEGKRIKVIKNDKVYCAKVIQLKNLRPHIRKISVPLEEYIVGHIHNVQHFVKHIQTIKDDLFTIIITDYSDGGDLFTWINKQINCNKAQVKQWFRQLLEAVNYLQSKDIVHRNIKAASVLLCGGQAKLTCFTHAQFFMSDSRQLIMDTKSDTLFPYRAPETRMIFNPLLADAFSLGVLLYYMLELRYPFGVTRLPNELSSSRYDHDVYERMKHMQYFGAIHKNWTITNKINADPMLESLLKQLLNPNTKERISFEQAQRHPWFVR